MSTDLAKKIILAELDIGSLHDLWLNYSAFTWYVDFDAVYDRIGPEFLAGVSSENVSTVGSVLSDAAALLAAVDVASVETAENTFYWDSNARRVYIHLLNGDRPMMHRIVLGITHGVGTADHPIEGAEILYLPHLRGVPKISKSRDPLFYGRLEYGGGTMSWENADGSYDRLAEDFDVFGGAVRAYLGFDHEPRTSFRPLYAGVAGKIRVGQMLLDIAVDDPRRYLVKEIPDKVFTIAEYSSLKDSIVGKAISIGYGLLRNVPVICVNEAESPAPANYTFKVLDVSRHPHGMHAINHVYVDGVEVTPSAVDLTNATFSLAAAAYDPGQPVTANIEGYEDDSGNPIVNALDIVSDILLRWLNIPYSATAYDLAAWTAARALVPDVAYFANRATKINEIIESICASVRGLFLPDRFAKWIFRVIDTSGAPARTLTGYRMLDPATIDYDPEQVIGLVRVLYDKDWSSGDYRSLTDDSLQEEVRNRYKVAPPHEFPTLLTNPSDAQAFATAVLAEGAFVQRPFPVRGPMGDNLSEVGDIVRAQLQRPNGQPFIGTVRAIVDGVEYDLLAAEETLRCRIIEVE